MKRRRSPTKSEQGVETDEKKRALYEVDNTSIIDTLVALLDEESKIQKVVIPDPIIIENIIKGTDVLIKFIESQDARRNNLLEKLQEICINQNDRVISAHYSIYIAEKLFAECRKLRFIAERFEKRKNLATVEEVKLIQKLKEKIQEYDEKMNSCYKLAEGWNSQVQNNNLFIRLLSLKANSNT